MNFIKRIIESRHADPVADPVVTGAAANETAVPGDAIPVVAGRPATAPDATQKRVHTHTRTNLQPVAAAPAPVDVPKPETPAPMPEPQAVQAQVPESAPVPAPMPKPAPVAEAVDVLPDPVGPELTLPATPEPKGIADLAQCLERINGGSDNWQTDAPAPQAPEPSGQVLGLQAEAAPPIGRANRRANRNKTRLLGFEPVTDGSQDPFAASVPSQQPANQSTFPVGWIVVEDGPGRGHSFALQTGVSQIGRGEDQAVRLDFGDTAISRSNHAAVAYDHAQQKFFLGHGGKANLVRLNGGPLLSTEEINDRDVIEIGETRLRFVALCSVDFDWGKAGDNQ